MEYIHVKNLEKYHPGYKDRTLQWAKIYFKMVQGDPDCEMIENETDWARFVKFIILELQAQRPIPLNDQYLTKKGFDLKKRPISKTIQMLHNFIEVVTQLSTLRYVDKDKEEDKDKEKDQPSAVQIALKRVNDKGFNIYSLINRLKKELKWAQDRNFPDEVLLGVCDAYFKSDGRIEKPWPWFNKVLVEESRKHFAKQNVKESQKFDKKGKMPQTIKEMFK